MKYYRDGTKELEEPNDWPTGSLFLWRDSFETEPVELCETWELGKLKAVCFIRIRIPAFIAIWWVKIRSWFHSIKES